MATAVPEELEPERSIADADLDSIRLLELRHRMKNLLGIVQAVANQTLRSGCSIDEARKALDGRLAAMGVAVDMLLNTGWTAASLRDLIGRSLVHAGGRIEAEGPHLVFNADAVMALTLVFHELESNSIKYGALSAEGGRVEIRWSVACNGTDRLELEWAERSGPACAPPSRQGFGSRMIAKLIGGRFRGTAETDYRPEGLRWRLSAPLARLLP
ncbi:MAG TPA: sensor histidine kinase [Allosphingosinicella sp.]|jgi:two-component sensor histidine kinase|nr:sensor histidine kinase [Allosphingosinicella sp.]